MKELIYDFYGYNKYLFLKVNNFCHEIGIEAPLYYISKIFDIEKFAIYYMVACIIGWAWFKNSARLEALDPEGRAKHSLWMTELCKKKFDDFFNFMMRLGTGYATFGFAYAVLKFSVNMARPFCSLFPLSFYTIADLTEERCLSSFPSSHTGLIFLITLFVWPYLSKIGKGFFIGLICLVALSRISLAMHFPADILHSLLITYLIFKLSHHIYKLFENNLFSQIKKIIVG